MKTKKSFFIISALLVFSIAATAQDILNIVLVGKDGVTDDVKKATSFIVIKQFKGKGFERLDYKIGAPLVKLRSYSDSAFKILNGDYLEYYPNGECHIKGSYHNNEPEKDWLKYDSSGKLITIDTYDGGKLIKTVNQDTVKSAPETPPHADDREADMDGGSKAWQRYLQNNMKGDVADKSMKGGQVSVFFAVDENGQTSDIHLQRSAEFVLDEEAERLVRASPRWLPALENGRPIKAYRVQGLTFVKD